MPTFTGAVSQSSDDAWQDTTDTVFISSVELANNAADEWIGARYQIVAIPNGATIISAFLTLEIDHSDKNDAEGAWYCQAADSASEFSATANDISSRSRTSASVAWTTNDLGSAGTIITTPDLAAPVQEVINRAGWASGNSLVFIYGHTSTEALQVASFDHTTRQEPRLSIEWQTDRSWVNGARHGILTV
jgi:hypothetical protein